MNALAGFVQDLRFALRSLRRAPLLAAICVITLALGIALNATAFTIVSGIMFRPRVEKNPERFVHLSPEYVEPAASPGRAWTISTDDYLMYAQRSRTLQDLAAWDNVRVTIGEGDSVLGLLVTCNFFSAYGLERPMLGRLFARHECAASGSAPVAVLSEEIWRQRFGADPQIVGRTIVLNRTPFVVTGVTPAGFSGRLRGPGIWMPWTMQPLFYPGHDFFREPARWLTVEGRLRPGFSRDEARADLQVLASQQDRLHPARQTTMLVTNGSLAEEPSLRGQVFWIAPVILGGLTLVLLVACTNVTILQLSRAVSRKREMAIRLSLGADRSRLLRMLLAESLVLASLAGLVSTLVVAQAPGVFAKLLASADTPAYQTRPDISTIAYLSAVVLMAACIAGITPAAESLRVDLATSIKTGGAGVARSRRGWYRAMLVTTQVSMTFVLLGSAGLFMRARDVALRSSPGFETDHVLLLPLSLRPADTSALADRIRNLPSVMGVAFGSPLNQSDGGGDSERIRLPWQEKDAALRSGVSAVSAGYFEVLSVQILRGRVFTSLDERRGSAVCVVSEKLASVLWPGTDPVGQSILLGDGSTNEVIGVVADVASERMGQTDGPHLYRLATPGSRGDSMLIRFAGAAQPVAMSVRRAVAEVDPAAIVTPKTLRTIRNDAAERSGRIIRLLSGSAFLTMLLAALGVFGVVDFTLRRRTKELGIRVALGASRAVIVKSALVSGMRPVLVGLMTGGGAAVLAGHVLSRVLRHTPVALDPGDAGVYVAAAVILGATALLAMLRPVWRAAVADPLQALREE